MLKFKLDWIAILSLLVLQNISALKAQNYPHTRNYCYSYFGANGEVFNASLTKVGDTTIQGRTCEIMDYPFAYNIKYLWYEGNQIYRYSLEKDSFFLLYDFDLVPGDTLAINLGYYQAEYGLDTLSVRFLITDIDYEEWNGVLLKIQYVQLIEEPYTGLFTFGEKLIERIGSDAYFVPFSQGDEIWANLEQASFDTGPPFETGNCIDSSTEGLWPEIPNLTVTPNPFSSELQIRVESNENRQGEVYNLTIYNIHGERIVSLKYHVGETINLEYLNSGVYLCILFDKMNLIRRTKIVKL